MLNSYDLIVLGDINLDWVVRGTLPFSYSELNVNGRIEWSPIDKKIGGSGLNFARFAQQCGYKPLLLGKVGNDAEGEFIISELKSESLAIGVTRDSDHPTGLSLIARDNKGIRFLVNNDSNANQYLNIRDVQEYQIDIEACRFLYVSGYCFMHPDRPRANATQKAISMAKQRGTAYVVFDVVPHQFYRIEAYNDFNKFRQLTNDVDILISEVATIRRFLRLGNKDEKISEEITKETIEYLKPYYSRFILRWGPSGCDHQVIWDSFSQKEKWEDLEHQQDKDMRGFGDRLALKVLNEVYKI